MLYPVKPFCTPSHSIRYPRVCSHYQDSLNNGVHHRVSLSKYFVGLYNSLISSLLFQFIKKEQIDCFRMDGWEGALGLPVRADIYLSLNRGVILLSKITMAHEEKGSFRLLKVFLCPLRRQNIFSIHSAFKNIVGT